MKMIPILSMVFINTIALITINSSCMENSNAISLTGELVIRHYMSHMSYETVKKEIETHQFEMSMITGKNNYCLTERDPFVLEVIINKKKWRSRLVKHIVPLINNQTNPAIKNILLDSINERIELKHIESPHKLIIVTASFYNKNALLKSVSNAHNDHKLLCSKITLQ